MADANAWAILPYLASLPRDFYPAQAEFAGNDSYLPSLDTGYLAIEKPATVRTYTGDLQGADGQQIAPWALPTDDERNPNCGDRG